MRAPPESQREVDASRRSRLDTLRSIEAPEGVELSLRVASPWPRALAWLLDVLAILLVLTALSVPLALFGAAGVGLGTIAFFLLSWGWDVAWEVYGGGATPGKRALRLKVVRDDGTPVGWTQAVLRNLLRPADIMPGTYGFGLASALMSADFQRLGDRVAGTLVVYRDLVPKAAALPKASVVTPPVALSIEEQAALIDFAARAKAWEPERRAEIAERLFPLTEKHGAEGVESVVGMALWVEGAR